MHRRAFFPLALLTVPVAVCAACYAPTEIVVELSTDLRCSDAPQTTIFRGPPFDTLPNATTSDCTESANADARIGTLTVVPTKDADRASLKVVVAVRGRRVEDCEAHPEDCIVARRSFSYVNHRSLRLPIRLLSECFGEPCADGTTCGPGGVCLNDAVDCPSRGDCRLPEEPPTTTRPGEADGGPRPGPVLNACGVPNGGVLATLPDVPSHTALGAGVLFYDVKGAATPTKIVQVPRTGGPVSDVVELPVGSQLLGIATQNDRLVHARAEDARTAKLVVQGASAVTLSTAMPAVGQPLTLTTVSGQAVAYYAHTEGIDRVAPVFGQAPTVRTLRTSNGRGHDVGADAAWVYVLHKYPASVASFVGVVDQALVGPEVTLPFRADLTGKVFATAGGMTWFVGSDASNPAAIGPTMLYALDGTKFTPRRDVATSTGLLALDGSGVYWSNPVTIWRVSRNAVDATPQPVYRAQNGERIRQLFADAGCLYFWTKADGANAVLRVVAASPP